MLPSLNLFQNQLNNYKKDQYNKIYSHEAKHKAKAGSLGGPIVIEKDKNGIPTGGHVSIKMPVLDKNDPQSTIDDAKTVISSALAPNDPSKQDLKVASEARTILNKAKNIKNEKQKQNSKLNYFA